MVAISGSTNMPVAVYTNISTPASPIKLRVAPVAHWAKWETLQLPLTTVR
jgi:hypothetical protein